jgi:hypothetical protein
VIERGTVPRSVVPTANDWLAALGHPDRKARAV